MKTRTTITALAAMLVLAHSNGFAASIHAGGVGTLSVDGTEYTLVSTPPDYSGLMWEQTGNGNYKACICEMFSFRALQALGQHLGASELSSSEITVLTGWNSHGPEGLFVDSLGFGANFQYADPITSAPYLTLEDAWFNFTYQGTTYQASSQAQNYAFTADPTHAGHQDGWDFFEYRTHVQTTSGMDDTKVYFRSVIRPQIVDNFADGVDFEVNAVPEPATLFTLGCGLAAMALIGRRRNCTREC
ncbi:MAG: PEP-CTERM sorting domain-containing protein [Desulfobulbus sp.]|jgi:YHS domain-containing protein